MLNLLVRYLIRHISHFFFISLRCHSTDLYVCYFCVVSFESSGGVKLLTTVTVLPGSRLVMKAPKEMLTNVPFPSQGYSFSVKFRFVDYLVLLSLLC